MTDQERHLSGSSAFISSQRSCATSGGLLESAFWLFLREDIYAALYNQRPMKADLRSCDVGLNFDSGEGNPCKWANWMVLLAAETVSFSFGAAQEEDPASALATWQRLCEKTDEWAAKKPNSFDPLLVQDRDIDGGNYFPLIYHSQLWHGKLYQKPCYGLSELSVHEILVIGWQYHNLAKILLLAHKPARPRVGLHFRRNLQNLQEQVVSHFRALVGLCLCSGQVAPRYQVCMGVLACGFYIVPFYSLVAQFLSESLCLSLNC